MGKSFPFGETVVQDDFQSVVPEGVPPPYAEETSDACSGVTECLHLLRSCGMVSLVPNEHLTADAYVARILQQQDTNTLTATIIFGELSAI